MILKRGISPLIATILLIAFTIVLMSLIINFSTVLTKDITKTAVQQCIRLNMNVKSACINGDFINIQIENLGELPLDGGFTIREEGPNKVIVESLPDTPIIKNFEIKTISAPYNSEDVGNIVSLTVIPKIKFNERIVICQEAAVAYKKAVKDCVK